VYNPYKITNQMLLPNCLFVYVYLLQKCSSMGHLYCENVQYVF